ncbi:T6SS immunity protein Tli4 family protein [Geomesophilobacter sediminis]|uniref:Tle cognate immunity protein 4 C-terminal domain-containing protein n=1 Tax=Geomesophilobacter sediminis TaxID=2798584 RepID=A0A8J7M1Y0_9BACT|nr:T6SS immunity protein Tli4 family protein [Geomesophilobacter sediminis]MBJ6726999.1 hypothetical protein [Geomesophilobacter sediminis]
MIKVMNRLNPFWIILAIFFSWAAVLQVRFETSPEKKGRKLMNTYRIGRFSIGIPTLMEQKLRSSQLRFADIKEIIWPPRISQEQARDQEWKTFINEVNRLQPPEGVNKVVILQPEFNIEGKWSKGILYYNDEFDSVGGRWSLLFDSGKVGVWLTTDNIDIRRESFERLSIRNYETIAKAYQPFDQYTVSHQRDSFYLEHGMINLPYSEQEESIVRFEGHPLNLTLVIEMNMDLTQKIEKSSLINGTRAMIAASILVPGGSISKIRLRHREVAGMPGEESVLRIREGDSKDLVFTWQFNGRDNSGEYPTTKIEMQSPDGNLDEKLQIWDAILDSMKPMFVRKPS